MTEISKYANTQVMQNYRVTMARHELSAIEMRIMSLVILKIKDAQINGYNNEVRDTSDLVSNFNEVTINNSEITVGSNHTLVKKALKDLRARDITLRTTVDGKPAELYTGLIREAKYSDDKSTIKIDLSPSLLPELIQIGKNYTKFGLEFLFKTKSAHAIRWYQIGSHWLKNGVFYISKEDIRQLFKAQDKYQAHKDFQKWLLTEPQKEVNEKSDITMQIIETHKKGRAIIGYTISVQSKKQQIAPAMPAFLTVYIAKYWLDIEHQALKANISSEMLKGKLLSRGVPEGITSQRHFNNVTNKYIATILVKDGTTRLNVEQMLRELQ